VAPVIYNTVCFLQVAPVIHYTVFFLKVTPVAYKIICCLKVAPVIHGIVNILVFDKCNVLLILQCNINFAFLNTAHYNIVRILLSLCELKPMQITPSVAGRYLIPYNTRFRYHIILRIQLPIQNQIPASDHSLVAEAC
jgi:hypothetical protein